MNMKKIIVEQPGGLEHLKLVDAKASEPMPGEVRVRWRATSLNYHDLLVANGAIPVADGRVPMSDGAGEIDAVGEGVDHFKVGDKVMSLFFPNWLSGEPSLKTTSDISGETVDGYASQVSCVNAKALTSMPENYSFAEAATLPCAALTAWRALVPAGNIKAGDTVLIQGSGGMSIFGLQFAKAAGAYVYATTSNNEKAEKLLELGADEVINYKEDERWGKTIAHRSGGVNHVLDVGGPATLSQAVEAVGYGGQVTLIGILGGRKAELVLPKLFFKHASLNGIAVGSRAMQTDMINAINVSGLKPVVDQEFELAELADAFRYQSSAKHVGKIVLTY